MFPRLRHLFNHRLTLTVALTDTGSLHTMRVRTAWLVVGGLFAVSGWLGMVLAGDLAGARLTATLTGDTEAKYYLDMIAELRSQRDAEREQMRTIAQQMGILQARLDRFDALSSKLKAEGTIIDVSGTIDLEAEEGIPDGRGGPEELPPISSLPSLDVIRQQVTSLTDKADTAEIALETSLALAIRSSLGAGSGGGIPYLWPVITDTYRLSSPFGWRSDPFRKIRKWHGGMDFADRLQSPIIAAADGVVTFVGWRMGYGNLVEIKHENGFTTRYGHLTRGTVKEGQRVSAGDLVALMGSTGRSTGSHLHFEIRKDDNPLNPLAFIKDTREEVMGYAKSGRGKELLEAYRTETRKSAKK